MKPFTLEWWIEKYDRVKVLEVMAKKGFNTSSTSGDPFETREYWFEKSYHYTELKKWIYDRIINKYGEK